MILVPKDYSPIFKVRWNEAMIDEQRPFMYIILLICWPHCYFSRFHVTGAEKCTLSVLIQGNTAKFVFSGLYKTYLCSTLSNLDATTEPPTILHGKTFRRLLAIQVLRVSVNPHE